MGAKGENVKERMEVAKRHSRQYDKVESEKYKSWSMPVEGFRGHVATDGSLLGKAEKMESL